MSRFIPKQVAYHRNGVMGLGFQVAIGRWEGRDHLVIRFPKSADEKVGGCLCATFDLKLLDQRNIKFAENSWRGDEMADAFDRACPDPDQPDNEVEESRARILGSALLATGRLWDPASGRPPHHA